MIQLANIKNLRPVKTKKEARERGRRGGIKSGEVKRLRKSLKEELLLLLEEKDTNHKLSISLIKRAMKYSEKTANSANKAFEIIRDTIGEKPTEKTEIGNLDNKPFEVDIKIVE